MIRQAILVSCALALIACGLQLPKPRQVVDVAAELCELTMGADAEAQGISVRDLCLLPHILRPFLQAPAGARMAMAQAAAQR